MSIPSKFRSHKDAADAKWFSRRHETDAEHRAEQDRYRGERDERREREQRQAKAAADRKAAARRHNSITHGGV